MENILRTDNRLYHLFFMKNFASSFVEHRVAKLGTNVIVDGSNINEQVQFSVAKEVIEQRMRGIWTAVVTSGAVTLGRNEFNGHTVNDENTAIRLFSTVGQKKLMRSWEDAFVRAAKELGIDRRIHTSEGILTRRNFEDTDATENLGAVVQEAQEVEKANGDLIFFVENGNDLIAKEHIRNDNDGLAGDFARAVNARVLYLLSNVEGLYSGSPGHVDSRIITNVKIDTDVPIESAPEFAYVSHEVSATSRGGMETKLRAIHEYLSGVENGVAHIGNGARENILTCLDAGECGTVFTTKNRK